ncbi:MAG TPA: ATP-binding protein [Gemmata sp.]|jgi:signal transduction histidine kinase|nr:ATP-binding protein [Gemmata sp.]
MLAVTVTNKLETQQLTHKAGPLEIGRGPSRDGMARVVVRDAFVSRDHVRFEELTGRKVRVLNLSTKAPVTVDNHSILNPGTDCEFILPVRLGVGETVVDIDSGEAEPISMNLLKTVAAPVRGDTLGIQNTAVHTPLIDRSDSASPDEIVGWLETVIAVQRAVDPQDFYDRTAKALVERIGLDAGLVLTRDGETWRVVAMVTKETETQGRAFSHTILTQVMTAKRTFYLPAGASGGGESLVGVQGVVASPIFDARDEVLGAVYGIRNQRTRGRELGPLEAQVVQLLAIAVGVGIARHQQDAEAQRLRVEKAAAEEADRAKSGFLAMVSHELRTPLTTIIGYSEMLLEQAESDNLPQYTADLKQVHAAGQHLLTLINDILDLSKIEAGKLEVAKEQFAPASLIRDLMLSVEPLGKKNNNKLELDCPTDLGRGVGDPTRIRQCVLNLIGNACKFTTNGVVKVTVRRLTDSAGDFLKVQVTDTGIGMTPDQVARLFQPFTQVDSSAGRKFGGTGLGLAISQKLCHAMGGQIAVESESGKGSTFTMTIKAVL